ncbi:GTP:AMP phosphotransferase AK3, mitochondrial [Atheta coriaria]|uniref:GTP:AMP phosphotransferase AK3, mitochondrial n=1 Tax=Dalotia coriaria TaxID=877792 RepID=UPI0031F44575
MAMNMFRSVILGAPASGKGTISSRIVNKFQLDHISSGDKLRLQIKNKTAIGNEVSKYTSTGKFVPDDIMIKFIMNEINNARGPWLLDGFPRTRSQCEALWTQQPLDLAINLVVPFEVIIDRVKNRWVHLPSGRVYNIDFNAPKVAGKDDVTGEALTQREDDKPEVVQRRLEDYQMKTQPVIDFFREKGILEDFEGRTSDEIWPKVLECLIRHIPIQLTSQQNV